MRLPKITRRRFLGTAAATTAGIGLYSWRVEPHWVKVVERPLPVKNLPEDWKGRRIVHISDPHVGTLVNSDYLISALKKVNELQPDMILVTGDWISCWGEDIPISEAARVFGHLKIPPQGIVGILGNHDYGGANRNDLKIAGDLTKCLTSLGIKVLRNQSVEIEGLTLLGFEDLWCGYFDTKPLEDQLRKTGPKLALVHNPDACDKVVWHGYDSWIFSGHTHGGQCKSPFLPPFVLPVNNHRYTAGVFDLFDGRMLHINPGLGYVLRARFNVRPEITVFSAEIA